MHTETMVFALSPLSGPDCGQSHPIQLPAVIGRANSATVQIADPALEPHHLVIDRIGAVHPIGVVGCSLSDTEQHLRAGSTRLLLAEAPSVVDRGDGPVVVRRPRRVQAPTVSDPLQSAPLRSGGASGILMSLFALAGAAVIAVVTGSWMFLAFGAVGLVSTGAVAAVDRFRFLRGRRREHRRALDQARSEQRALRVHWPIDLVERAGSVHLWEKRRTEPVDIVVGVSDSEALHGSPDRCRIESGSVLALRADPVIARAALRSAVAQLLVAVGPADLDVDVDKGLLEEMPGIQERVRHTVDDRMLLIIVNSGEALVHADTPVRRLLDSERPVICICLLEVGDAVPAVCTDVVDIGSDWAGVIDGRDGLGAIDAIGVTVGTWSAVMDRISGLVDPEDPDQHGRRIPASLELTTPAPGVGTLNSVVAMLGDGADGPITLDLVSDGPHALVAGTTGSGKSELLRTIITSLCLRHDADTVTFLLIDHKGGAAFDELSELPQVVGVVTDLDGGLINRVLTSLEAEVRRREVVLRLAGVPDLAAMERGHGTPARLVIIVDEFAALAAQSPGALRSLVDIAQRGRSLGMHLILATQRPAGVIDDAVRANTNIRIALRLNDRADALDVIGDDRASRLDRHSPGRALIRIGADDPIEFQTAVTVAVPIEECRRRSQSRGIGQPHRPWADALPSLITTGLGLVDACEEQRHRDLEWDPNEGNLALVGSLGAGTTTALVSLAITTDTADIYLLDGRGDPRLKQLAASRVAAPVVSVNDRERVGRLLHRIVAEVDTRRETGLLGRPLILMVDGIGEAIRALDHSDLDHLDRIADEGPGVGVVVVSAGGPVHHDLRASTWLFHLDDPSDGHQLGIRPEAVPPEIPGRFVDLRNRRHPHEAQISLLEPSGASERSVPTAIEILPAVVSGVTGARLGWSSLMRIGVLAADLDDARIEVPDGEHLLVVGPARSGRSEALNTIGTAWREATGGRVSRVVRGDSLRQVPVIDGPHLVLVDDAHSVDDDDGRFAARLEAGEAGLMVVAAGHGDALRSRFGHWTSVIRRSRRGLVFAAAGEADGDLIGATLPIRSPIPPRPGLGWICVDGESRLAQIATCKPVPVAAMLER